MNYTTLKDARAAMVNDVFFNAADLKRQDEIIEYMYRNNCDLETALNELGAWA